ncbi:MAG: PAAR domain-containing protein, partial [Paludibacterium sp.]|uniref:PAAR domain-containing protein n=1 Tax=Paludibacterium sp. TaxID=1917523 RepID=UPI0025E126CE
HENCVIVEGDDGWKIDGRPVALDGHRTSCGAVLIATLGEILRDPHAGAAPTVIASSMAGASTHNTAASTRYDMHFQLQSEQSGRPMANVPYKLTLVDGTEILGHTDSHGRTEKISADHPALATLIAPYYEHNDTEDTDADDGCCTCHSEAA